MSGRGWFFFFPIPWAVFIPLVLIVGAFKLAVALVRSLRRHPPAP